MREGLFRYLPGLAMVAAIGAPALMLQSQLTVSGKTVVSAVAVAIVLGVLIRNLWGLAEACKPGVSFAVKRLLRVGIALLGAQLSLGQVLRTGATAVLVVAICIVLAILVVRFLSTRMGLSDRLGTLLGVGTSICGVSAIVATAPAIEAKQEETSMAVATITVFGLLAVVVYPLLGRALGLSDVVLRDLGRHGGQRYQPGGRRGADLQPDGRRGRDGREAHPQPLHGAGDRRAELLVSAEGSGVRRRSRRGSR